MARHRRRASRSYSVNAGYEAARQHIEEAQEFAEEMGGTVEDVKSYFFELGASELDTIFKEYGQRYGADKENYARTAYARWKAGTTQMSGLVAKRLFAFLPPRMPLRMKYELAENIWKHFGPSSKHALRVGANADLNTVAQIITGKLDEVVSHYSIPYNVQNRFDWLAAGDVRVKEQLLNYFLEQEKLLLGQKLMLELPVLQKQMLEHQSTTGRLRTVLKIHKHEISVNLDRTLDTEILEGELIDAGSSSVAALAFWIVVGIVLIWAVLILNVK